MNIRKILIIIVLFLLSLSLFSQYNLWYYGKNKVIKKKFDWNHLETPHFKIYYYTTNKDLIKKITRAAEHAYNKISNYLNIKVKKKIPMIFYITHIDFEQTNIIGYVPPGALAFAESNLYRVVIQGDSSFEELSRTITHELGHIFEYQIIGQTSTNMKPPPMWIMEGFSEFITDNWNHFSLLTVRDSVLNERIPLMLKNGNIRSNYDTGRTPYDFGHLIFEFLNEKFGKRGVKRLLYSLKQGSFFRGVKNPVEKVFNYSPKLFNYEFGKYARKRFKKFVTRETPEDYSILIGPDFPYAYSLSHQVSPSGELLATLTVNRKDYDLDIILISLKDGKIIKNITPGFTSKYDNINLQFNPTDGISFSWNKKGDKIAFFARKEYVNYLVLIDILNGKILKKIKIKDIQQPTSPNFYINDKTIYFTGLEGTKSHIYSINLEDNKIKKTTSGALFIKSINISPDGKKIVFSAKTDNYYKLYLGPIEKPEHAKKLTSGNYNDITPVFSNNLKFIYYSSDQLESYNINSIDLEEKILYRYTDVKTGNFFPIEIPEEKNKLVISSFYKGVFSLFKKDTNTFLEKRSIEFEDVDTTKLAKKEYIDDLDKEIKYRGKYKPLKKLFIRALPTVGVSVGTQGGFWGYSYITMSDLMGDHNFSFMLSSLYGYRSYHVSYLNQKSRLQLYAHLFSFKDVYYYGYNYDNYLTLRTLYGGELGFFYPFNRSYRIQSTISLYNQEEDSDLIFMGQELPYGQYFNGMAAPFQFSLVGETTRFANYGPNMGHTFKFTYKKFLKFSSSFLDAYTIQADIRKYIRIDNQTLFAFRLNAFKSGGANSLILWTGGNNTIRSQYIYSMTGNNVFFFNAEFRFPLIQLALTPLGLVGPVRGVLFFDIGGAWFNEQKFKFFEGDGIKLQDAISSYGFGIEFFLMGFPFHVEWVYKTNFSIKKYHGVNFWIGFDF